MEEHKQAAQFHVDEAMLDTKVRVAGFVVANSFLELHHTNSKAFNMSPVKLIIFMTIVVATVQRFMREREMPQEIMGGKRMPRELIGYISRRAIASSTGLPRETVRRTVLELEADGLVLIGPKGGVANRGGILERPEIVSAIRTSVHQFAQVASKLSALGVITADES